MGKVLSPKKRAQRPRRDVDPKKVGWGVGGEGYAKSTSMVVTECICTLCSCYCTLCVTSSVSLAFSSAGCGGMIIRSFICNNCFTYVLRAVIWDVTKRRV